MNAEQRKYLIQQVNDTYKIQKKQLEEKIPKPPSLNNFLVRQLLENSIKFKSFEGLKKTLKTKATEGVVLQKSKGYSRYEVTEEYTDTVEVKAEDLFEYPKEYLEAKKDYDDRKNEITNKLSELEAQYKSLVLRINIGSNTVLDKLIAQVDALGDIDLMNTRLLNIEKRWIGK